MWQEFGKKYYYKFSLAWNRMQSSKWRKNIAFAEESLMLLDLVDIVVQKMKGSAEDKIVMIMCCGKV